MTAFCGMIGMVRSATRSGANLPLSVSTTVEGSDAVALARYADMSEHQLALNVQFADCAS